MSLSWRRIAGIAASVVAAAGLLTGCEKPRQTVTASSGRYAETVAAQLPCVLLKTCPDSNDKIANLRVQPGSTILLDVPRELANAGWIATAFTQDSTGKGTAVEGAGTSPTNKLAERLQVPLATGGYFLRVTALRPSNQLTTWLIRVRLQQ